MLGRGVHPKIVSEMLGHMQISVTLDLYSSASTAHASSRASGHVTPTMQREATRAMEAIVGSPTS